MRGEPLRGRDMHTFLLFLLPYWLLMAAVVYSLCAFRSKVPGFWAMGIVSLIAWGVAVFLILRYPMGMDMPLLLFYYGFMVGALAISLRVCGPVLQRQGLGGTLTFLICGSVIFLVILHPWNHLVGGQSTSEHVGIRNRTLYTLWWVVIPLMLGSLFNPRAWSRFLHPWKVFCYAYVLLSALNVRVEQYFYYNVRFSEHHDLFLWTFPVFHWAPFAFAPVALLIALAVGGFWRSRQKGISPPAEEQPPA
jgi:hypothetical protein